MNPTLEIHKGKIAKNAEAVLNLCRGRGIEPAAVIKGYNAIDDVTDVIVEAGYKTLSSSRLPHLRAVKRRGYRAASLMLRLPMLSEIREVVEVCDASLNSEAETLARLDAEASQQGKRHGVILMRDLGDLREGIIDSPRLIELACRTERCHKNLDLLGIGSNLSCYGSVMPTCQNLSLLADDAAEIEREIGRKLDVVSGGESTSLQLLLRNEMPGGINHLRIGGAIMLRAEFSGLREGEMPDVTDDTLILKVEIIEIGEKPTHPIGVLGVDCFGNKKTFEDRGVRRRALAAIGAFDVGSHEKLVPLDENMKILGCSSDHMIIDIHDCARRYALGDIAEFKLLYQAMLYATANPMVSKVVID
ncbi:MAG: alanine racemase [Synergistaceae bacterium]|jgi:predicted amino acid racemase|nr:alanine racemase [Synergistaceae bacterium]